MNVKKKRKRMLYFALREGPRPSQIESSNLGMVLLQVIGSWLRSKLGGRSHEEEAKAAIPPVILSQYHFDHVALVKVVTELASFQEEGK